MKVLITGAAGQLGRALSRSVPEAIAGEPVQLITTAREGGSGVRALDLTDAAACRDLVQELRPDWVINAAAYTAVDRAESEPELARAVNAGAPAAFAEALQGSGGRILQLSTDFVFNGQQGSPYRPQSLRDPLGVYGASKAAGEAAVEQILGGSGRGLILRTSWVMGPVGHNFALTMLRLHRQRAGTGEPLAVVADQVGCPTSTHTLAAACGRVLATDPPTLPAVLHWCDAGAASWYDVAVAVGDLGQELGLLAQPARVVPITSADYPTPARRPSYSLLDCTASRALLTLEPVHWRTALRQLLAQLE